MLRLLLTRYRSRPHPRDASDASPTRGRIVQLPLHRIPSLSPSIFFPFFGSGSTSAGSTIPSPIRAYITSPLHSIDFFFASLSIAFSKYLLPFEQMFDDESYIFFNEKAISVHKRRNCRKESGRAIELATSQIPLILTSFVILHYFFLSKTDARKESGNEGFCRRDLGSGRALSGIRIHDDMNSF